MTPEQAIAALDRQIAKHGQTISITRQVPNASPVAITIRAFVRPFKAEEITDGIPVGSSHVVVSPTALRSTAFWGDENLPRKLDAVVISGRKHVVDLPAKPIKMNDELVRVNLVVAG